MPWKPAPQPKCAKCDKSVYPTEKLDCLDKIWHKACFVCTICNLKLTMNTYKGYERMPYCNAHYPHQTATQVADTPESIRLRKQTERQSVVAYHRDYEKSKGQVSAGAQDFSVQQAQRTQKAVSHLGYDQRGDMAPASGGHAAPAASYEADEAAAPVHHHQPEPEYEPEPEPQYEPEPEPEPEPAYEPEPEAAPVAAGGGGDGARYLALYDYEAADNDEVSFNEGDFIINAQVIDEGWMSGTVERTGQSGMLPSNYVEPQ